MKTLAATALLLLFFCATAPVSGDEDTETTVTSQPGDVALLPCYTASNVTPSLTTWMKDGREIVRGGGDSTPSLSAGTPRLVVLQDGGLNITKVERGDEGTYLCTLLLPGNNIYHGRVQLRVASGPENVTLSITFATPLSNGTLIVFRGSTVSFNCSASSYPFQHLTWGFSGLSPPNDTLLTGLAPWLEYKIENVQPGAQGVYSCTAHNAISNQTVVKTSELLVYYAPDRHPECMWTPAEDTTHIHFNCTWFGAYPTPTLRWGDYDDQGSKFHSGHLFSTQETDSLSVTLNRSHLMDGQTLTCMGQHLALESGHENTCSFTLKPPFPEGQPMATAVEQDSITLTCSENMSVPPASTTWRKGLQQEVIMPGPKYILSEDGPVLTLTIVNISKEDEGYYFCRSENPLNITELEIFLTVKTSSTYTGVIIGIFIAALIVGSTIIIAKTIYNNRHRICIGGGFGRMEDNGDVLDLVESDDEIFHDTVPRLPPLPNGNHTTLVQIHRIPSNEHEDAESVDTSAQLEDTVQTEEPRELVTF